MGGWALNTHDTVDTHITGQWLVLWVGSGSTGGAGQGSVGWGGGLPVTAVLHSCMSSFGYEDKMCFNK